ICLPRSLGGLGLLNPTIQQAALQIRWLQPILSTPTYELSSSQAPIAGSIVLSRLLSFLYSQVELYSDGHSYHTPAVQLDHRFFFLFPLRRPSYVKQLTSSLFLLFKAIDLLPHNFADVVASAATCLEIPLSSLVLSPDNLSRSTASLISNTTYTFNTDRQNCLRPLNATEFSYSPRLAKTFLRQVSKNEIILAPFFIRCFIPAEFAGYGRHPFIQVSNHQTINIVPFIRAIGFLRYLDCPSEPFTTQQFRRLCSPQSPHRPLLPPPYSPKLSFPWSQFWLLPLSHSCRNIWYRLIHNKFPHHSLLHRFMPDHFPTPSCPICRDPEESLSHFLFTCPSKLQVWQHMWKTYIDPSDSTFSLDQLTFILHTLQITPHLITTAVTAPLTAFAATLEAIWLSHWTSVFNDVPFTTANTISLLTSIFLRMRQESFMQKGIPHAPLPPLMTN
ncbi:hypothetical protein BD770DRAFT_318453, partial [Pilaira anomala]